MGMVITMDGRGNSQQTRIRALVVPREHGAWGLLFVPLLTGAITGLASAPHVWPTLWFALAALVLFWLRTPLESLIGSGPMVARTSEERTIAFLAASLLTVVFAACLVTVMWGGHNLELLSIGAFSAMAFIIQTFLRRSRRNLRMPSQLVGTLGLTATVPAAYYVASGRMEVHALILWLANWFFAANQIHFVQLRIHACRARTLREKLTEGKPFLAGQALLLCVLGAALSMHLIEPIVAFAFAPALFRGTRWFFQAPEALNIKNLGWSEMRQGVAFGVLLTLASFIH
jgi:hypothetical protein